VAIKSSLGRAPLYLVFVLGLFARTFWFNAELRQIREKEVNTSLKFVKLEEVSERNFIILGRIDVLLDRLLKGEITLQQMNAEARLETMLRTERIEPVEEFKNSFALQVVNILRTLLGKPHIKPLTNQDQFQRLEEAYLRERLRRFKEAEQLYRRLLEEGVSVEMEPPILIHLAFCILMQGRLDESKLYLERLKRDHFGAEEVLVANHLEKAIEQFQQARQKPLTGTPINQARELARRLEFGKAQERINEALGSPLSTREKAEALKVLADIAEHEGQFDASTMNHEKIILLDPQSDIAKESRRRLVFINRVLIQAPSQAAIHEQALIEAGDRELLNSLRFLNRGSVNEEQVREVQNNWVLIETIPGPSQVFSEDVFLGYTPLVVDVDEKSIQFTVRRGAQNRIVTGPFKPAQRLLIRWEIPTERRVIRRQTEITPNEVEKPTQELPSVVSLEKRGIEFQDLMSYLKKGWWIRDEWLKAFSEFKGKASQEELLELERQSESRILEEKSLVKELENKIRILNDVENQKDHQRLQRSSIALMAGAALIGAMAWSIVSGNQLYDQYKTTEDESVSALRLPLMALSAVSWTSGILGGTSLAFGGYGFWEEEQERKKHLQLDEEIKNLQKELEVREPEPSYFYQNFF